MVDWGEGSTQVTCTFGGGGKMEKVVQKKKKKNTSPNKREYAGGVKQLSKQTSDKEPIISSGRPFTKYFRSVATTHLGKI